MRKKETEKYNTEKYFACLKAVLDFNKAVILELQNKELIKLVPIWEAEVASVKSQIMAGI